MPRSTARSRGSSLEVIEIAEPRAEIVERDADAEVGQLAQTLGRTIQIGDQHLLGDLERQVLGRKAHLGDRAGNVLGEIAGSHVGGRDIERQAQRHGPVAREFERGANDMVRQRLDQVRPLGNLEQHRAADHDLPRMVPASERFGPDQPAVARSELGLKQDLDLIPIQRGAQILGQGIESLNAAFGPCAAFREVGNRHRSVMPDPRTRVLPGAVCVANRDVDP
jgi:hypothetical protein